MIFKNLVKNFQNETGQILLNKNVQRCFKDIPII